MTMMCSELRKPLMFHAQKENADLPASRKGALATTVQSSKAAYRGSKLLSVGTSRSTR